MFDGLDHTAFAVASLDDAIPFYRDVLGLPLSHRETVAEQGVDAVLFDIGDSHIELIAPLSPEAGVARFLEKRGPGMHHVAYRVADIEVALAQLSSAGVRLIDAQARVGIRGSLVAFVHPSSTGGVLTEIVQVAHG